MLKTIAIAIMLILSACSSVSSVGRPLSYYDGVNNTRQEDDTLGALDSLKDAEIEKILNYRLKIPKENRIAIMKMSKNVYWHNYSSDFIQLTKSISTDFIGKLRKSPRIYDASFLPEIMVPEKKTMKNLRGAAARYQADLLVIYRTNCQSFEKYKLFDSNKTKAYCSTEALLIDTRTGIVPFTSITSNEYSLLKTKDDTNFRETIKKAELTTVSKNLSKIAEELNIFLANTEVL